MLTRVGLRGLGDSSSPRGSTVLELLFDIVYVFALARLAGRVADDLTIVRQSLLSEAGQTLLFFLAMWMIWSLNALMSSTFDILHRPEGRGFPRSPEGVPVSPGRAFTACAGRVLPSLHRRFTSPPARRRECSSRR
ncbi:low temperature requirement protein A [Micromonospora sp. NPDC005173]|uniref:low temperature requirement protein A n=1 Tax=Micromonospora sp. NPDC005173 TaxID=3157165 RepID=UPI0033B89D41